MDLSSASRSVLPTGSARDEGNSEQFQRAESEQTFFLEDEDVEEQVQGFVRMYDDLQIDS